MLVVVGYFFKSPFRLIRQYDQEHPESPVGPYGEIDFYTFQKILHAFSIPTEWSICELGSGRGRLGFWLVMVHGQNKVVCIERHPMMAARAARVQNHFAIPNLEFVCGDWQEEDLSSYDLIYLYALSEDDLTPLAEPLARLKKGTHIITIGWWLGEYLPDRFFLKNKSPCSFEWGKSFAYLQKVL